MCLSSFRPISSLPCSHQVMSVLLFIQASSANCLTSLSLSPPVSPPLSHISVDVPVFHLPVSLLSLSLAFSFFLSFYLSLYCSLALHPSPLLGLNAKPRKPSGLLLYTSLFPSFSSPLPCSHPLVFSFACPPCSISFPFQSTSPSLPHPLPLCHLPVLKLHYISASPRLHLLPSLHN